MQNQYLEILELNPGASKAQIKSAYRRLSKIYHPDVSKDENARERFIEINEAYKFLTDVGPRPTTIQSTAPAYDYDVQDHTYDDWRRRAKAYARKKAEDETRRQEELTKLFLKIFGFASAVVVLLNFIVAIDLCLPQVRTEGRSLHSSVFNRDHPSYYESLTIDKFQMKFKKRTLDFLLVSQMIDKVEVFSTPIFEQPTRVVIEADWKTYELNQYAGLFGLFKFIPFLIIGLWCVYRLVGVSLDAQLSLAVLYIFIVFAEMIIHLISVQ
ncbi:J domain-containing protein [Reichenbachiella sp.]|uniref:J domain-containing protein n=1 Tax=Reichenbachiella sp. TaxID=2184521 RepID=UPI003BAE29BE